MPHCIIEHSPNFYGESLNQGVYLGAFESGLFSDDGSDIKVRSLTYDHYQTGENAQDFVHVTVKILSGRTAEDKQHLSHSVMQQLKQLSITNASLTVEIVDMDKASYSKFIA